MSSDKPSLFRPPAFTLDLFNEYVDENDDKTIEEGPMQGGLFVKTENNHGANIDGNGYNYDNDDEVAVFARRSKRPKPFRANSNPFVAPTRVPTLTQQGRRLPKDLRMGYRRGQQEIIMGGDSYEGLDYSPNTSQRRVSTPSYAHVHTTMPATNLIPTSGGGYLVTNSFMSSAQRKRLEQQESIEKVLTDLEECIEVCPTDVKLQAKLLHLRTLQQRLLKPDSTALKGAEASLIKDVEKMLERRRINMAKAEFESQAKTMVENMVLSSSAGTRGRKRTYDEGIGSMTPLSSDWSETAAPSERSSFSHPSTGGKTVPQHYYQKRKRGGITHRLESDADADDEFQNDKDDDEDVVWDDENERKTYGGKTIEQGNMGSLSDYEIAKVLTEAMEEEAVDKKDENEAEDSGDNVDETSDDNTDDERDMGDKGKGASHGKEDDEREEGSDEEDVAGGKGDESNGDENDEEDEVQKETEEDGGNGDANE